MQCDGEAGGQVTIGFRRMEHELRVYSNGGRPIAYANMGQVAQAGAALFVTNLDKTKMAKTTSRQGATLHDEQNHVIQQRCASEELGDSPLVVAGDEGSKRGKSWCVGSITGSRQRGDGRRLREVMGARRLMPDANGKKKTGPQVGAALLQLILLFFRLDSPPNPVPDGYYNQLTRIANVITDFTNSNSGMHNGSIKWLRCKIRELTKSSILPKGHLLMFNAPCLSHVAHNESGSVSEKFDSFLKGRPRARIKKKKRDDDGIIPALDNRICVLLDDLADIVARTQGVLDYLSQKMGRKLGMPTTGVSTRWGFYIDAVAFWMPRGPMLDHLIDFVIEKSQKRERDDSSDDSELLSKINSIANEKTRDLLCELANPSVRVLLVVFELYGTGHCKEEEEEAEEGSGIDEEEEEEGSEEAHEEEEEEEEEEDDDDDYDDESKEDDGRSERDNKGGEGADEEGHVLLGSISQQNSMLKCYAIIAEAITL